MFTEYSSYHVVSEPDPRNNRKEGLGEVGAEVYCAPRMQACFQLVHDCMLTGNNNRNSLVQFKETENKQDLLTREVVEHRLALIRPMDA